MTIAFKGTVQGDSLGALKIHEETEDWYRTIWVPVESTLDFPKGTIVNVKGELDHINQESFNLKNATVSVA